MSGPKHRHRALCAVPKRPDRLHTDAHLALHVSGLVVALGDAPDRPETVLAHALGQLEDGLVLDFVDEALRRGDVHVVEEGLESETRVVLC